MGVSRDHDALWWVGRAVHELDRPPVLIIGIAGVEGAPTSQDNVGVQVDHGGGGIVDGGVHLLEAVVAVATGVTGLTIRLVVVADDLDAHGAEDNDAGAAVAFEDVARIQQLCAAARKDPNACVPLENAVNYLLRR